MHNQENLEEGYFGDLAKNIIGRPAFAKASKVAQKASDYVRVAADKLSGVSQSLGKEPEILSPTKSWSIPVDAEEGRRAVEHYHNGMSYRLDSLVRKHAQDAQWDLNNLRDQVDPKVSFFRYGIRDNIEKERMDAEEQAAKAALEAGKKRKPKPIKDVTDADIAKALQDKHKPIERRREIISTLIGNAHSVLANHVLNAKEAIYQGKKPHTGIHLNTGFSGPALDEDHITAQYKKAWDSAGEHQASMPSPEQLFGSHTHHVGEGHDWILAPQIIGTELAKDVAKANKQARKAYADAVTTATGHINNLNAKRAEQRATNAAGTQLKLVEAVQNHRVKLDYGMIYGGFPSKKSKFLTEEK